MAAVLLPAAVTVRSYVPAAKLTSDLFGNLFGTTTVGGVDGNGVVFVSKTGDVYPTGFLPLSGGNVRRRGLVDIYRNSDLFAGMARGFGVGLLIASVSQFLARRRA